MLQFITHQTDRYDTIQGALLALQGGCRWIQLRMKTAPHDEILRNAIVLKRLCWDFGATLIIDDHVDICLMVDADGVHLGKEDMDPEKARIVLGKDKIIGGTANTFADVQLLAAKGVDYIGLGPYRFTETKKKLSPVLGLEGYRSVLENCKKLQLEVPVIAIGGLRDRDFHALLETGVAGVALSSSILSAVDPKAETKRLIQVLSER